MRKTTVLLMAVMMLSFANTNRAAGAGDEQWVVYPGNPGGPGNARHIVLVGGDEEYRSEEALPQLGKILSKHHGYKCTVLFAVDPKTGEINPDVSHIPGIEALDSADLMIIATRFRNLPDEQMKHVVDYIEKGKPVIGLRTATHAFKIPAESKYAKYSWDYKGDDYKQGFGKQVLGETWVSHHGKHGSQSTRGILTEGARSHPILRGIKDGDIWGPTDVYTAAPPEGSAILVLGQVVEGMKFDDKKAEGEKNDPMMPVAWTKTHKSKDGVKTGKVFTTTMGAATDLVADGTRKMIVNAVYWAMGNEWQIPPDGCDVTIVGKFEPTPFGFGKYVKGRKPSDFKDN